MPPQTLSTAPMVSRTFRFSNGDGYPKPNTSDPWSFTNSRIRTSSTATTRTSGKGKEKEIPVYDVDAPAFSDPFSVGGVPPRVPSSRTSARPTTADAGVIPRRNRASILGAASDAFQGRFGLRKKSTRPSQLPAPVPNLLIPEVIEVSAPKLDDEELERQRLRDAAAQSIGIGLELLESKPTNDSSVYEGHVRDWEGETSKPPFDLRSLDAESINGDPMAFNRPAAASTSASHSLNNRRRAGSLSLTHSRTNSTTIVIYIPAFPSTLAALSPFANVSATLPKHYPPPSLLMLALSKQWKNRHIVLTIPSSPSRPTRASDSPAVSYLHIFRSSAPEERELERLEINEKSVVFVTDDEIGSRRNVVKVGGVDVGAMRSELNSDENGQTMLLLQILDTEESAKWINAIKNAVLGQRSIRAGLSPTSYSQNGPEPRGDMDVMLSMRMQGMVPSPVQSASHGASDQSSSASSGPSRTQSTDDQSVGSPTSSPRSSIRPSSPRPTNVLSFKGLFSGSRPRSPSRTSSPTPDADADFRGDSFGSVGSNLLNMRSSAVNGLSPTPPPIIKPHSMLPISGSPPEPLLQRKIVQNRTSVDWAPPSISSEAKAAVTPPRAMSPSLQLPPHRRRAWTTNEGTPSRKQDSPLLVYNHGNASTAGSFGVTLGAELVSPSPRPSIDSPPPSISREGTPTQKRASSIISVSTLASGDRENSITPVAETAPPSKRRWSRQSVIANRLTPPSGSPPPIPPQSGSANGSSHRLSHPPVVDRAADRPPSRASSSTQSHRTLPGFVSSLYVTSKRASTSSSVYSDHSSLQQTHSSNILLPVTRTQNGNRTSMPPPQRPAPSTALPPTPPAAAVPSEEQTIKSQRPRPGSAPVTMSGSMKLSLRDSVAHRALRLSMLPPASPPSHSPPPRPDEPKLHKHTRNSSIDGKSTLPESRPPPTGPLPPPPPSSTPKITSAFRQRLRILSAPSPAATLSHKLKPLPIPPAPSSPPIVVDDAIPTPPVTPIGERITTMQNDPSFLQLASPVTPHTPFGTSPTASAFNYGGPSSSPPIPPRSPRRPSPSERPHEMTSLSPPPRRGARQPGTPKTERDEAQSFVLCVPEDASSEMGERPGSALGTLPSGGMFNVSTLSLGLPVASRA
ncbi:hypothetical protein OF83DRAFT_1083446 [Amylostereum chailletii]|nr:hypothetical protein OF83DRAFT_1083446 [Amylostereum chailletii]